MGRITAIHSRTLIVEFPHGAQTLTLARGTDVLVRVELGAGRPVRVVATGESTTVVERGVDGALRLANGAVAQAHELWPLHLDRSLFDRLAAGDLDDAADLRLRLDMIRLLSIRQADGLGSFLGGRVRLFPHQLHVAERASAADPVRWLLADEVGLGKTIEACLILNRLVHTGRVERCLVVAPNALTVQWLGELWRKYHQVFTLLDEARLADVERDFGAGFNPFDVHRRAVIALETLVERPHLTTHAVDAGTDLLIVDEAQHLRRPPGHPGEPGYRAIAPIAALGRHVLLLSATPLEDDAHGFFRLLQLLRPDEFPDGMHVEERLASGAPLPACTSSTRRIDIGGLPPRVGIPVAFDAGAWRLQQELERLLRHRRPDEGGPAHALAERKTIERVQRALSSGSALAPLLGPDERELRQRSEAADAADPRLRWLASKAPGWRQAGEKTLVFVARRETLELVRAALGQRAQLATGVFHEELGPARRDTEVARFREPEGPSLLVSTEAGGEGRNFEFCRRLVLFDLPWKPTVVEQRIGRLDRIGRRIPVEVVYFVPPSGIGADVVRLFEALGVFREPLAGLEPQLAHLESAFGRIAVDPAAALTDEGMQRLIREATAARTRVREAAYQQLHRDAYQAGMADAILSRIPANLDTLVERVVTAAAARLGFSVERMRGSGRFSIEFGGGALVDSLPGVAAGSSWVGTFDREEAVQDETIDFYSSGHALVEGLLAYCEESTEGRVACLELPGCESEYGVAAIFNDRLDVEVSAWDARGRRRADWEDLLRRGDPAVRPLRDAPQPAEWGRLVEQLRTRFDGRRTPHAVAALMVRDRERHISRSRDSIPP